MLVFGSRAVQGDDAAFLIAQKLKASLAGFEFEECQDPFSILELADSLGKSEKLLVLDAVRGISAPREIKTSELAKLNSISLHDFDLAKVLQLLEKLHPNAVERLKIIGVPLNFSDNFAVETVLKKVQGGQK